MSDISYSQRIRNEMLKSKYKTPSEWEAELASIILCCGYCEDQEKIRVLIPKQDVAERVILDAEKSGKLLSFSEIGKISRRGGSVYQVLFEQDEFEEFIGQYLLPDVICDTVSENDSLRRAMLKGAFLARGSMSDPNKSYRVEILCKTDAFAKMLVMLFHAENIEPAMRVLDGTWSIYFKKHSEVSDYLVILGCATLMLELQNIRAQHEVNKMVARSMNLDTWTMKQQAEASAKRTKELSELLASEKAGRIPKELREVAQLHIDNPGLSLSELGKLMDPPISKSGMNHRLKKLIDML